MARSARSAERSRPAGYAKLVKQIIENEMLSGEVIWLDRAIRLAPK